MPTTQKVRMNGNVERAVGIVEPEWRDRRLDMVQPSSHSSTEGNMAVDGQPAQRLPRAMLSADG